jgi:putative addiction module component (TIGR02574 family)
MNERVKKLSEEVRKLTPDEQAALMDELLALAVQNPDPAIEQAWAEEAERRLDAFERGETDTAPADNIMNKLRYRLARKS